MRHGVGTCRPSEWVHCLRTSGRLGLRLADRSSRTSGLLLAFDLSQPGHQDHLATPWVASSLRSHGVCLETRLAAPVVFLSRSLGRAWPTLSLMALLCARARVHS